MAKIKEFDGGDDAEFRENMKQQEIIIRRQAERVEESKKQLKEEPRGVR